MHQGHNFYRTDYWISNGTRIQQNGNLPGKNYIMRKQRLIPAGCEEWTESKQKDCNLRQHLRINILRVPCFPVELKHKGKFSVRKTHSVSLSRVPAVDTMRFEGITTPSEGLRANWGSFCQDSQLPLRAKQREMKIANMEVRAEWVSVQFSSVAQSCSTLCDPMNRSTPGLPVQWV